MSKPAQVFFGYPSLPESLRQLNAAAAVKIGKLPDVSVRTWEDLPKGGRLLLNDVLAAIERAVVCIFDVSDLNPNVLFELGYALTRNKVILPIVDASRKGTVQKWKEFALLKDVGYLAYHNSDDVLAAFSRDRLLHATPVFESLLAPTLIPAQAPTLLYARTPIDIESSRALSRRVAEEKNRGIRLIVDDPRESTQTLQWYAQHVYEAAGVVVHMLSTARVGDEPHNARCSLIAGMARGLLKPVLMLVESPFTAPFDYHDVLKTYDSAKRSVQLLDTSLGEWMGSAYDEVRDRQVATAKLKLAIELKSLRLGDHVAENEVDSLPDYFVETEMYRRIIGGATLICVGRKGVGKSATFFEAARASAEDKRVIPVVIKPPGYELESLLRLFARYQQRDSKAYLAESLWKYLLYSEMARAVAQRLRDRPAPAKPGTDEWTLLELTDSKSLLGQEFAVRLERTVDRLLAQDAVEGVEKERANLSEALHAGNIAQVRKLLPEVIGPGRRVAILVDNLDKAWDRFADIPQLSYFLFGLLSGISRMRADFAKEDLRRKRVDVTLAVFMRTDIFSHILDLAREPDKIPYAVLRWERADELLLVLEKRFIAAHGKGADGSELWSRFFCDGVRGQPIKTWLVASVLPRPRDLLYLVNTAIAGAVSAGHARVEEEDFLNAESSYSKYAFEAIQVENGITVKELEEVLYEFVGSSPVVANDQVESRLQAAGIAQDKIAGVIRHLRMLSFLGIEVGPGVFRYADEESEMRKADALAAKLGDGQSKTGVRYEIHPAFRRYLEVK